MAKGSIGAEFRAHPVGVVLMAGAVVGDVVTTWYGIERLGGFELNPLAATALAVGGYPGLLLLKLAGIVVGLTVGIAVAGLSADLTRRHVVTYTIYVTVAVHLVFVANNVLVALAVVGSGGS